MKAGAVDPHGLHPEPRRALDVGHERVSHVDHVIRSDPEGFEGRLEDPGTRFVRLRRLRCDHHIEPQAVSFEDVQQELVIRIRDDGPRDTIERIEDSRDFGVRLRLPPQRDEAIDVRPRGRLDSVLAKRLLEAVFRDLRQREERGGLRREEVTVPRREERLRVEARPLILTHGAGDADEHVPSRIDEGPERVERDRSYHRFLPRTRSPLSLSTAAEVAEGLHRTLGARRFHAATQGLRVAHEERVVLLIRRQVPGNPLLEVSLDRAIFAGPEESDPATDPFGVRIDDEDRVAARVQQDRVRGLRADAILSKQVRTHLVHGAGEVTGEVASGTVEQMPAERSETSGFRLVQACDPHVSSDDGHRCFRERPNLEQAGLLQISDRDLDVPPGGLLHQKGADDCFDRRLGGPPVLRSVVVEEPIVDGSRPIHLVAAMMRQGLRIVRVATGLKVLWLSGRVNPIAMFASIGGVDEVLFRALNLAGTNATLDLLMILITTLGGTYILALFAIPLWLRGQREATFDFILILVLTVVVTTAIKYLVDRSRPCVDSAFGAQTLPGYRCETEPDPSFPSGHASRAFALAGLVALRFRWRAGGAAMAFATLVGVSRVYMGLHWPSDILGGAIVGIGIAVLVEIVSRRVVVYQRIRKWIIELIPHWPRRKSA